MTSDKSVHTIILDAGPIIKGDPSVSSLLAQSEQIVTLPSVIQEIRDEATRSRLQTTLLPFLTLKSPREGSVKIITDFARKTGDLLVLSRVDINLLALAYDLECERNGGDWRLRKSPGEKRINGPKPDAKVPESAQQNNESAATTPATSTEQSQSYPSEQPKKMVWGRLVDYKEPETTATSQIESASVASASADESASAPIEESQDLSSQQELAASVNILQLSDASEDGESSDSDSEGWITPSNLKKKAEEDVTKNTDWTPEPRTLQVALLTSDYAMQNVALQMNLNLLSPSLNRVRQVKTFVLRCHACFNVVKDISKQFCPRCGKPTLTRVSCSTDQNGQFKLHLKKNMQWNTRGDRYSVPKPVAGAANGRVKGGGKGGWGNDLILAEDQKEYVRAMTEQKRQKQNDFMDEDYLPGILGGNRSSGTGRVKVGAGKNVNSKKRR